MKHTFLCLAVLALPISAYTKTEAELKQEMQLKVSKEYSKCGAYYEIAASVLKATSSPGIQKANTMKKASLASAVSMAAEFKGKRGAKKFTNSNYADAIEHMRDLGKSSTEKFKAQLSEYRTNCRKGVDDPASFIDAALSAYTKDKPATPKIINPGPLSVDMILKHAKPTKMFSKPDKCSKPAELITISLNDTLLEKNRICPEHNNETCNSETTWLYQEQYLEKLYPTHTVLSSTRRSSVSIIKGQMKKNDEIIACLAITGSLVSKNPP